MRPIPLRSRTLVIFSSLFQILPFPIAGPVPVWRRYFCWFCLTPLFVALLDEKRRLTFLQAALLGYVCGFFWYLGNCYWIYQTMHVYGQIPKAGALGILMLFSLYLALYHSLFAVTLRLFADRFHRLVVLCAAPFLWVAVELARSRVTGFPWDLLGYTQVDSPSLIKLAPITGVMGLSLLVVCVNVLWIFNDNKVTWKTGPIIALVIVALAAWPVPPRSFEHPATAVLLQENLSVGGEVPKQTESRDEMISSFQQLSRHPSNLSSGGASTPQMVIWPESPADFFDADPSFRKSLGVVAKELGSPVISDSISVAPLDAKGKPHLYNTASFFSANGEHVGHYDKMHLVPFGEYTPYKELFFFAGHLLDNVGPFVPGDVRQTFAANGHKYGVFICYESIFGDEIREFGNLGADVLVNISDDGWYGDTSAPWEHLDMVRMRAIENSRWVLRATNTGITAVIDPQGHLSAQLPRHVRSSIAGQFGYRSELTFYTKHGDWLGWMCASISALLLLAALNRRRAVN